MQLWSIYAAGNTVPIPFLRATDISPIALLSDNVLGGLQQDTGGTGTVEALQELFSGDGQSKKGRRGLNEVTLCVVPMCGCMYTCSTLVMAIYVGLPIDAADASSSKHLPKVDIKFYTYEFDAGFSLP